jgi:hypothetical protein
MSTLIRVAFAKRQNGLLSMLNDLAPVPSDIGCRSALPQLSLSCDASLP